MGWIHHSSQPALVQNNKDSSLSTWNRWILERKCIIMSQLKQQLKQPITKTMLFSITWLCKKVITMDSLAWYMVSSITDGLILVAGIALVWGQFDSSVDVPPDGGVAVHWCIYLHLSRDNLWRWMYGNMQIFNIKYSLYSTWLQTVQVTIIVWEQQSTAAKKKKSICVDHIRILLTFSDRNLCCSKAKIMSHLIQSYPSSKIDVGLVRAWCSLHAMPRRPLL